MPLEASHTMLTGMSNTGPALSTETIAALEARLGAALPTPYRDFLLRYNGGRPQPYYYDVPGWSGGVGIVNDFNGVLPGQYNDIEGHTENLRGRLPSGFIPIGDDPGGNALLIALREEGRGKIYFWDHGNQPYDCGPRLSDYPNIFLVADDLDTFLQGLR